MKDVNGVITYKGRDYKIVFNLNVMERIQEEYGSVDKWGALTEPRKGEPNAKAVIFGLTEMINEGIDIDNEENDTQIPFFTKKQVGRILSEVGMDSATQTMKDTIVDSVKDDIKNA